MDQNNIKNICHFGKVGEEKRDFMRLTEPHDRVEMMNDIDIKRRVSDQDIVTKGY